VINLKSLRLCQHSTWGAYDAGHGDWKPHIVVWVGASPSPNPLDACHALIFVALALKLGRPGHAVASQLAFLHAQLYLSTNLDHILFSTVSWH